MKKIIAHVLLAALGLLAQSAPAQNTAATSQDTEAIRQTAEQFLRTQTTGLSGQVHIHVGAIDPRTRLPTCPSLIASFSGASRAWGKTTITVGCQSPSRWTIYVPATVQVIGKYAVTAQPLTSGHALEAGDLMQVSGDIASLPAGAVLDPARAVGRTLTISLKAGSPLRQENLRNQQAMQQGQTVKIISNGQGFQITAEARALNNAFEGQVAQARTVGGQVVSGVAKVGGVLEVDF